MPSSTSRVGARSWAGSEQWCRCHVPRSLPQEANLAAHPAPYRRTILARGCVLSATRSPWPLPNHLPRRRPSPNRHLCWPSTARASFERQAPTRADHEPVVDAAGDHADPGHPSRAAACPAAALHDLTSAGHSGRWTPDAGRGHRQGDEGTAGSGPPGPPRRATARWDAQTMFLWTAPAVPLSPWRLGGEATFQREIALALPCSCLVAPPGPSGASAHCCPET